MANKKIPAPIDRPLSKAYLREFRGWSTAFPPGTSEPNSLRLMENVWVDRNQGIAVRPGLRNLTYLTAPGLDPLVPNTPGTGLGLPVLSSGELFYTNDGKPALLIAVREAGGGVGFRAIKYSLVEKSVYALTDPEIGFTIPQGEDVLNFTEETTHVEYLQINNRIVALSDKGESARMFFVGGQKIAKKLKSISVPEWTDADKLIVVHPDAAWINQANPTRRRNSVLNPSFEIGTLFWKKTAGTGWSTVADSTAPGGFSLEMWSLPERTNLMPAPLHDVVGLGIDGWWSGRGLPELDAAGPWLQVSPLTYESYSSEDFFLSTGPRMIHDIDDRASYRVAVDFDTDPGALPIAVLEFYAVNGMPVGQFVMDIEGGAGRWASSSIKAPEAAVSMQLHLGARGGEELASVRFSNIVVCRDGESTDMFHGGSGTDYFWEGTPNQSASTYHPPVDLKIASTPMPHSGTAVSASAAMKSVNGETNDGRINVLMYPADLANPTSSGTQQALTGNWETLTVHNASVPATTVSTAVNLIVYAAARGQKFRCDSTIMESAAPGAFFDGSTPSTTTQLRRWEGVLTNLPHEGPSIEDTYATARTYPPAETPTTKTLIASGGADNNPNKIAFFYTFENDIGESAASRISEVRVQRAWSDWVWETANAAGEPSGTYTPIPEKCADQLVVRMPRAVYDQAVAENALRWNLYAFAWTEQQPVPVVAQMVASKDIFPDQGSIGGAPVPYEEGGWIQITPSRRAGTLDMMLPTQENRVNSSIPPDHRNGIVAGDRMVLVGSPTEPATISWSSSAPGRYTMFTPNHGGGKKTLTSGNLNLPHSVVLWQNPQSVDTLTVLCSYDNGRSSSYYMQPAEIQAGNTGFTSIMGFEETTSTPGSVAPFGAQVLNNALYRPMDRELVKSTANNYNINHKSMSDMIADKWLLLQSKPWIMSAALDNRLYFLVHNPQGELLLPECKGNEIWIYDIAAEEGHWSRFLVQGSALKPVSVGDRTFMSVSGPDGIRYFDDEYLVDDELNDAGVVQEARISWMFETNTQGANRAHDAWAHLQQVGVTFGNWRGRARYGIRGRTVNGVELNIDKVFIEDEKAPRIEEHWNAEDYLLIRRDLKEWVFRASSVDGYLGTGMVGYVQYRYTPVSVNVGYEAGSIETFEYGAVLPDYARNGIVLPRMDGHDFA
jgi:hypothetical protein